MREKAGFTTKTVGVGGWVGGWVDRGEGGGSDELLLWPRDLGGWVGGWVERVAHLPTGKRPS